MASVQTLLRPPPTLPAAPPTTTRNRPSTAWYWLAGVLAVLGLAAAVTWGAVGTSTALDRVDGFARVAIPGQVAVQVTHPDTMVVYFEGAGEVVRYADPTGTGQSASRWNRATAATIGVSTARAVPSWQQFGLEVTGPDGAAVLVKAYRSGLRYDVASGRLGTAVATFQAGTAGQYQVSAARSTAADATLAVGDNFGRGIAAATLWAAILGLVTVLGAALIAVAAYRARSRASG